MSESVSPLPGAEVPRHESDGVDGMSYLSADESLQLSRGSVDPQDPLIPGPDQPLSERDPSELETGGMEPHNCAGDLPILSEASLETPPDLSLIHI